MNHTGLTRRTALAALTSAVATITTGCGGGGSDGDVATPPPPPPTAPLEPGPVTSVPPAVYADVNRKLAFDRLNWARASAGLGLFRQSAELDQAAQAHSRYMSLTGITGHDETPGNAGFTGATVTDRAVSVGYLPDRVSEVGAAVKSPAGGIELIDSLLGTPYHRMGMLLFHPIDAGYGVAEDQFNYRFLTGMQGGRNGEQQSALEKFIVWPVDNAVDIPYSMWPERPDPIPENLGNSPGYAASIHSNEKFRSIEVDLFEMRTSAGNLVDAKLLSTATDDVLRTTYPIIGKGFVALLPRAPLMPNSTYSVVFRGKVVSNHTGRAESVSKDWRFSTGSGEFF
ncbi:MAG: hypothetical protein RLZZ618_3031 [Pseudomonadota bacterium]